MKLYGNKKNLTIASIIVLLIVVASIILIKRNTSGEVVKTALSSDAHYALTTDAKNYAILWDLRTHRKNIISRNANMYSAYWILNTPYYMWQSLNDKTVHIVDVNTHQEITTFHPGMIAYGQALSQDLHNYILSDIDYNVYFYQGNNRYQLARMFTSATFEGANKIINFTFLDNNQVLASGMSYPTGDMQWGPTLWSLNTKKTVHKYIGNMVQTFATISPDGKYVVAGDMNATQFVWDIKTSKRLIQITGTQPILKYTNPGVITDEDVKNAPNDFYNAYNILTIKYIDADHYLVFTNNSHYAILYQTLNPKPIKYLDLGTEPWPSTDALERDQSIDTSSSTHILVVGKRDDTGIMVYRYDPTAQTLVKVWDEK